MDVIKTSPGEEIIWDDDDNTSKTWWKRRTPLEKKLIILLIVGVSILIAFTLYSALRPAIKSNYCATSDCVIAASSILSLIDSSVDPCEDFFEFSCGTSQDISLEEKINKQLKDILESSVDNDDHYLVKNQKKLYEACMNETATNNVSLDKFKHVLKKLNDWPVVVGHKWKDKHIDWMEMIIQLRKMGYHYSMILDIDLLVDPTAPQNFLVDLRFPFLTSIPDRHKEMYIDYMADVAEIFGADSNRAAVEMEKVLDFREKLIEISNKEFQEYARMKRIRITVQEYQKYFDNDTNWLSFINAIIAPNAKISNNDYVIVPDQEIMNNFLTLMYKTSKRTVINYIIWRVIETLMPVLSQELTQLQDNYYCLTDKSSSIQSRFELCLSMIRSSYLVSPIDIMYARKYLPEEYIEGARNIINNVKNELKELLTETDLLTEESKEIGIEKLNSMKEIIGVPGNYFDDSIFEQFNTKNQKEYETNDFLTMYLNRKKQKNDMYFSLLRESANETESNILLWSFVTQTQPMYFPDIDQFILPIGILQKPIYILDGPMYLNYASLGRQIGSEIMFAFEIALKEIVSLNYTDENYMEVTKCLNKITSNFKDYDSDEYTYIKKDVIVELEAIKATYRAYQKWKAENGEESDLINVDYTPNQLFWINMLHSKYYYFIDSRYKKEITSLIRNNDFIRSCPEFVEDFQCSIESKMNPTNKC